MYLIGSQAAHLFNVSLYRETNSLEYDLVGTRDEYEKLRNGFTEVVERESKTYPGKFDMRGIYQEVHYTIEFDATNHESNGFYENCLVPSVRHKVFGRKVNVPTPDVLYYIKRAHANYPVNVEKTLNDLYILSKYTENYALKDGSSLAKFYRVLRTESFERYSARQAVINLNKSNDDFFSDNTKRKYNHDSLHRAVAYYPNFPMYLRCKRDWSTARVERDLWDALPYEMKLQMAREELYIVALERFLIPNPTLDDVEAYRRAFTKLAGTMTKGFFQDFLLDNIRPLRHADVDYLAKFHEGVANKTVVEL